MTVKGLLVMDVDSTLIEEEVIDLLGEKAGLGEKISEITEAAIPGPTMCISHFPRQRVGL